MRQRNVRRRRAVATWRRIMKNAEGQSSRPIYHAYFCHLRGHSRRSCRTWSRPLKRMEIVIDPGLDRELTLRDVDDIQAARRRAKA